MTSCHPIARLAFALPAAVLLLSGCGSGRDAALAEKMVRAERAAERAETAQKAAEQAADAAKDKYNAIQNAETADTAPVVEEEREAPVDTAGSVIGPPDPA